MDGCVVSGDTDGISEGVTVGLYVGFADGSLVGVAVSWQTMWTGSNIDNESSPYEVPDATEVRKKSLYSHAKSVTGNDCEEND